MIKLQGPEQWLADLPKLIAQLESTYRLSDLKPVEHLTYNYVLSGFQDSQAIVLKLGADTGGLITEAAALKAFAGLGVVKVLAQGDGFLLLERAMSGISLKSYFPAKDGDAVHLVCQCIKRLHRAAIPKAHSFPHIKDWLAALDERGTIPANYLQKAQNIRDTLLATSAASVLLHGDLHHDNLLQHGNHWLAIDPKGVIGEPAYEVAAFIRNPLSQLLRQENAANIINDRITRFANTLELSASRIRDWCFVQAVLAWVWSLEDGHDTLYFRQLTQFFDND